MTRADDDRRYRSKRRAFGKKSNGGKHTSLFEKGVFVAIDGEGFNEGPLRTWQVGDNEIGRAHV